MNGMVIGYGSGEETRQSWPDIWLQFDSSIRAAKGTRATIYVLDAITGHLRRRSADVADVTTAFHEANAAIDQVLVALVSSHREGAEPAGRRQSTT